MQLVSNSSAFRGQPHNAFMLHVEKGGEGEKNGSELTIAYLPEGSQFKQNKLNSYVSQLKL